LTQINSPMEHDRDGYDAAVTVRRR